MNCIKTGFHALLIPYNQYLYGDAFRFGDHYLFRVCQKTEHGGKPIFSRLHFHIHTWDHWFDEDATSQRQNSTLIVSAYDADMLNGYEGISL